MRALVIGATGRVGGRAVRKLIDNGDEVYAVVRKPAAQLPDGVHPVIADLTDPDTLVDLPEVDGVFLVFASVAADPWAAQVVAALSKVSPQIAYVSAADADQVAPDAGGIMGSHALLERLITESGVRSILLRASGFAANTLAWAPQIAAGGPVRWFVADAQRAFVHEDDLAAVGVQALIDGYRNSDASNIAPHLTGPQSLTQRDAARIIGEVIGRPVEFVDLPTEQAVGEIFDDDPELGRAIVKAHSEFVTHPDPVTTTVEDLLGRPARTYAEWVADHRAEFVGS